MSIMILRKIIFILVSSLMFGIMMNSCSKKQTHHILYKGVEGHFFDKNKLYERLANKSQISWSNFAFKIRIFKNVVYVTSNSNLGISTARANDQNGNLSFEYIDKLQSIDIRTHQQFNNNLDSNQSIISSVSFSLELNSPQFDADSLIRLVNSQNTGIQQWSQSDIMVHIHEQPNFNKPQVFNIICRTDKNSILSSLTDTITFLP
jgi:hypothetical protein